MKYKTFTQEFNRKVLNNEDNEGKQKKLVLIGDGAFAEIAHEYFTQDSEYEVIGFAVEKEFLKRESLCSLPVVSCDELESIFPPKSHDFYVAITSTRLNRLRSRFYRDLKGRGYKPASYISSKAIVMASSKIGEHIFIFEGNVVQSFSVIGDNVVLWSGNHIGHHSTIDDNCFVASHVAIAGFSRIGKNCFLGVNSSLADKVTIGADCIVGAGAFVSNDLLDNSIITPVKCRVTEGARVYFGLEDDE